jgi:S1-C subfamily serine protease
MAEPVAPPPTPAPGETTPVLSAASEATTLSPSEWIPDDANWMGDDASDSLEMSNKEPVGTTAAFFDQDENASKNTDPSGSDAAAMVAGERSAKAARSAKKKAERNAAKRARTRDRKRNAKRRVGIFPRSIIGICLWLLTTALAVGAISAALYMNYAYKKDRSVALVDGLDKRIQKGSALIDATATNAQARIQDELGPLSKLAATGETMTNLLETVKGSLWVTRTYDEAGAPSVGTAFVVASDAQRSFLLTSFNVVRAATITPGPDVLLRQGSDEIKATLWTWDEANDVALLIVERPSLPKLSWARATDVRIGNQIFAASALGTAGGAVTQGFVADVANTGLQHSAPLGSAFRGAPLLDDRGRVIAVGSKTFAPLGFVSDGVYFAPPIGAACAKVLRCEADVVKGAGAQR